MKLLFLGTGTSVGVPIIGCDCDVCTSEDPRNRRLRASVVYKIDGKNLLVDTSTDLRMQALNNRLRRVDAVLYTHAHADHTRGLDELRTFNFIQKAPIDCHAAPDTAENIRKSFEYVFAGGDIGGGIPQINLIEIDGPFDVDDIRVTPIPLTHGRRTIFGFRIGDTAYLTDTNGIPETSYALLEGLDVLVLDALRHKKHPTHFCLSESLAATERIAARRTYLTHMSHDLGHEETSAGLPDSVVMAYDSLEIECQ